MDRKWSNEKGDLKEDSYKIPKQFNMKTKNLLRLNKDEVMSCKHKEENKFFINAIR